MDMNVGEICRLAFCKELKGLSSDDADCFTIGLENYFRDWYSLRQTKMCLLEESVYANIECLITSFSEHEYWPYSPHFIRVFTNIIGRLFETTIYYVSISDPGEYNRNIIMADNRKTAWVVKIKNKSIYMMYPRKGIEYRHYERVIPAELHNLSDMNPEIPI